MADRRSAGNLKVHAHFVGDDPGQCGFAQAGRAVKQSVIQRFSAIFCGLDINGHMLLDLFLSDIFGKKSGPKAVLR